jgi:hypothetical protein
MDIVKNGSDFGNNELLIPFSSHKIGLIYYGIYEINEVCLSDK